MNEQQRKIAQGLAPQHRQASANHQKPAGQAPRSPLWRGTLFAVHSALAIALIVGGAVVLNQRAQAVAPVVATAPLTVSVQTSPKQMGYQTERRFAGRIEAARQTSVASELSGTIVEIAVSEGQRVNQGDVIARFDTRSLRAGRAQQLAQRRALAKDRELANLDAQRQLELKRQGYTSGQAWDAARLRVEGLDSTLAGIDAALRATRINIGKSLLRAPFDGTIGARLVDEGSTLAPGAPVVTLYEQANARVRVGLPPAAARTLRERAEYQMDIGGQLVPARLVQWRPDLNKLTRTVTAILELESTGLPRFGQIAQLVLKEDRKQAGFWLPLTALKEGERGLWDVLTVIRQDGHEIVARESVEVLHADGQRAFVRGTLGDDALFIADGVHRVTVGQHVRAAR